MAEVIVPKKRERPNGGVKRDYKGKEKKREVPADHPRNAYTSMFETFRDELDEHHDRRMRIGNVSRDVTALSKKIIFSLQRVRKLNQPIPENIQSENDARLKEIAEHLSTIQADVQGMNRYRYQLYCNEEFIEAVSFAHYLSHGKLITPSEAQAALPVDIPFTVGDYVGGIFDLTGEIMRIATAVTALTGSMPASSGEKEDEMNDGVADERTILTDMQDVSSMMQICPPSGGKPSNYQKKMDIMIEQVRKVERLGYGVTVRGTERPKGWMPNLEDSGGADVDE
ncbi:Translin [Xylariaceae sp. FL1019]|nr:Translin [Xylariaceae sp. FL1019]